MFHFVSTTYEKVKSLIYSFIYAYLPEVILGGTVDGLSFPKQELKTVWIAEQQHHVVIISIHETIAPIFGNYYECRIVQ